MTAAAPPDGRERVRCGAKKRNGDGTCGLPAGHGTDHVGIGRCSRHGGSTPTQVVAARREQANQALATYGLPRAIDPHAALLEELHRTAGHVAWLASLLQEGETSDLKQYATGENGSTWERPAIWVELYARERKHFREVAKDCITAGIEERRVQLAEAQGAMLAAVIAGVLDDLGVRRSPEVSEVVRRRLTMVAGT